MRYIVAALLLACLLAAPSLADDKVQAPVAIRWWGQGMVSIETWWDLTIVIDPYGDNIGYEVPDLTADLVLVTHEHADHNNVEAVKGEPLVRRGLDDTGAVREMNIFVDRFEGTSAPEVWGNTKADSAKQTPHSIHVVSIPAWHDDSQGSERGAVAMFKITVDGVSVLHCGSLGQSKLSDEQVERVGTVDVLLFNLESNVKSLDLVQQLKPRAVLPIGSTDGKTTDKDWEDNVLIGSLIPAVGDSFSIERMAGNTWAVGASDAVSFYNPRVIVLKHKPWKPKGDLATLLDKMDAACQASQEVFAPLSAEQLNWRPPNGTHTPRWNAEHMLGRQLGFFSQIYSAIDPETFTHIDLNPKQMPDDYQPAHPDWDGAEQARQMQRASAYVHRFAYLLDGVDLDAKAPGSFWTPRRLLKQMDRHFAEHTGNVEQKFTLEGWPAE